MLPSPPMRTLAASPPSAVQSTLPPLCFPRLHFPSCLFTAARLCRERRTQQQRSVVKGVRFSCHCAPPSSVRPMVALLFRSSPVASSSMHPPLSYVTLARSVPLCRPASSAAVARIASCPALLCPLSFSSPPSTSSSAQQTRWFAPFPFSPPSSPPSLSSSSSWQRPPRIGEHHSPPLSPTSCSSAFHPALVASDLLLAAVCVG